MENVHTSLFRSLSVGSFKEHRLAFQVTAPENRPFASVAEVNTAKDALEAKLKDNPEDAQARTDLRTMLLRSRVDGMDPATRDAARNAAADLEKIVDKHNTDRLKLTDLQKKNTDNLTKFRNEIAAKKPETLKAIRDEFAATNTALNALLGLPAADQTRFHGALIAEHINFIEQLTNFPGGDGELKQPLVLEMNDLAADGSKRTIGRQLLVAKGFTADATKNILTGKVGVTDNVIYTWDAAAAPKTWKLTSVNGAAVNQTVDNALAVAPAGADKAAIDALTLNMKSVQLAVGAEVTVLMTTVIGPKEIADADADIAKSKTDYTTFLTTKLSPAKVDITKAKADGVLAATITAKKEAIKAEAATFEKDILVKKIADLTAATPKSPKLAEHIKVIMTNIEDLPKQIAEVTGDPVVPSKFAKGPTVAPTTVPTVPPRIEPAPVAPPATAESQARIDKVNVTKTSTDIYDAVNADAAKKTDLPAVTTALATLTASADYKALTTPAERKAVADKLLAALRALDASKRTTLFATKQITVDETKADKPMTIVDAPARVAPVGPGTGPEVNESNMMKVLKEILDFLKNFLLPALKEGNAATLKQIREDNARLVAEIAKIRPGAPGVPVAQIPAGVRPFYRIQGGVGVPDRGLFQARIDGNNIVLRRFDEINRDISPFQTVLREDGTMLVNNPDSAVFIARTLDGRRMICRRRLAARPTGPVVVKVDVVNNTYNITNVQGNAVVQNGDRPRAVTNQEATVNGRPAVRPTPAAAPRPVITAPTEPLAPPRVVEVPRPTVVAPPAVVAPPVVVPPPVVAPPAVVPPVIVPPTARPSGTLGGTGSLLPEPK
jgi:hypothetical protein